MSENITTGDKRDLVKRSAADNTKDFIRHLWTGFRPRFWLSSIWKKISIRSRLSHVDTFLRNNFVPVSFSLALALYYLLPKLDSRGSKQVPYSDLIEGILDSYVTDIQFEEDSKRIFYNTRSKSKSCLGCDKRNAQMPLSLSSSYKVDKLGFPIIDQLDIGRRDDDDVIRKVQTMVTNAWRKLKNTSGLERHQWEYSTTCTEKYELLKILHKSKYGIRYGVAPQSVCMIMRTALIYSLHNCDPLWEIVQNVLRNWNGFTKSKHRSPKSHDMVKFEDVQGVDAAKTELMEIVYCLQGDRRYKKLGAKLPRGVLLMGPPGTGKTLIARAMAGEAGVPFFSISASEFVELYVGVGAARIRDLFNVARRNTPSIIFIDEIDCIGARRHPLSNSEDDQTLNQLLTEMDGFDNKNKKVVVIGATNRAEILDPALCRPGRFTRKIVVGKPDEGGRRKILVVHLRGILLEEDTQLICNLVASLTEGLVGADLANIVNEAVLLAARRGGEFVSRDDITGAVERAKFDVSNWQLESKSNDLGQRSPPKQD